VIRAAACILVTAACSDVAPSTRLDGARILAIIADPPVIAPGTTTRLTAISTVDGLPASPDRIAWRACAPWAVVADPLRDCIGDAALALDSDAAGNAVLDIEQVARQFSVDLPTTAPTGCEIAPPKLTVVADLEVAGARLIAKKQIPLAATVDLRNPVLVAATIDGEPLASPALPVGETVRLSAEIAADTLDVACQPDGGLTLEEVRVAVYLGGGAVVSDDAFTIAERDGTLVAGSVEVVLPDEPAILPLWLVAVDDTGGVAAWFSALETTAR